MASSPLSMRRLQAIAYNLLALAYTDPPRNLYANFLESYGFTPIGFTVLPPTPNTNTRVVLYTRQGYTFFAALGTTPRNALRLLSGWGSGVPLDGPLRVPVSLYAQATSQDDLQAIASPLVTGPVVFCGHSLGGAYVTILAAALDLHAPISRGIVFTFGSPCCFQGNPWIPSGKWKVEHVLNDGDGVSRLPVSWVALALAQLLSLRTTVGFQFWTQPFKTYRLSALGNLTQGLPATLTGLALENDLAAWVLGNSGSTTECHAMSEYQRRMRLVVDREETASPVVAPPDLPAPPDADPIVAQLPDRVRDIAPLFNLEPGDIMSVSNPRVDRTLLPSIVRVSSTSFAVVWMSRQIHIFRTRAAARIVARDLTRVVRRMCGLDVLLGTSWPAAVADFCAAAAINDGRIVPPPDVQF